MRLTREDDTWDRAAERMAYWLASRLEIERPELVVFEGPMSPEAAAKSGKATPSSLCVLHRIYGSIIAFCAVSSLEYREVSADLHHKHTTGKARWPAGRIKPEVIAAINKRGVVPHPVTDDNEADALSIHCWATTEYCGRYAGKFMGTW